MVTHLASQLNDDSTDGRRWYPGQVAALEVGNIEMQFSRAYLSICIVYVVALLITSAAHGQRDSINPPQLEVYKGRRIAQTMHYQGADWLIREVREDEERCSLMLANLGVKPGMTVCDMGCGNGFYALQLAKMVGNSGKVLGVDIQPEMLEC
jgi:hypothetical protein